MVFRPWRGLLPDTCELIAVVAPGRESRVKERPFTLIDDLATEIATALDRHVTTPVLLVGHSFGGLVATIVQSRVRRVDVRAVVVAGTPPPDTLDRRLMDLTDTKLKEQVRGWGQTPEEVLSSPAFDELFLPCLHADLTAGYNARASLIAAEPLRVPLVAMAGLDDEAAPQTVVARWSNWAKDFTLLTFAGGHFFPLTSAVSVVAEVERLVAEHTGERQS